MKALKIVGYIVGAAILLSILLVVGLTSILTTSWGQTKILNLVNDNIPGKVTAKEIHLSWFGDQKIDDLELTGNNGDLILKVGTIEISSPLLKLISTRNLSGSTEIKNMEATLKISKDGTFNVNDALGLPSPEVKTNAPIAPIELKNVNASLKFEDFFSKMEVLASGTTQQGSQQGDFQLNGTGGSNSVNLQLKGTHFPLAIVDQIIAINRPDLAGIAGLALGDSADFVVGMNGNSDMSTFEGTVQSPNLKSAFKGNFKPDLISFETPFDVNFIMTPKLYQKLIELAPANKYPKIANNVPIKLTFATLDVKLNDFSPDLNQSAIAATAAIGPGGLDLADNLGHVDIDNLNIQFNSAPTHPSVSLKVQTKGKQNGSPISADFQLNVEKPKNGFVTADQIYKALKLQANIVGIPYLGKIWNMKLDTQNNSSQASATIKLATSEVQFPDIVAVANYADQNNIKLSLEMVDFPVALVNLFLPEKDLAAVIGPHLTVLASGHVNSSGEGKFKINVQNPNVDGKATVAVADRFQVLSEESAPSLKLRLDPEQFATLHKEWLSGQELPFRLAKPATATINLPVLDFNLSNPKSGGEIVAMLDLKDVALIDNASSNKITLGDIKGEIKSQQETLNWKFNVNGLGEGSVQLSGMLPSPFSSTSSYSLKDLSFDVHMDSVGVPVVIATRLAGFDQKISKAAEAMLGPRVEVKADISLKKLNGPINAQITGDNGSVVLDGRASNGILVLNKPLVAQSKITPQFGKDVFGLVLPILNSALNSDSPCQLTISEKGFAFPFSPYDFKLINVDSGSLSLGKINFSSQGELASLLGLLNVSSQDQLLVWFTPIYFSLRQEKVKVERFDMLASNKYPLAIWGNVDFANDYVDLQIGLTAKALAKALGIKGYSSKDMLEIPLRGPIGSPSIDKRKVSAQITKIALQSKIPEGQLVGDIIGLASSVLGGSSTVPPPTTQPLPWNLNEDGSDNTDNGNQKHDVIDQVQKGVNSFLKNLIPK